MIRARVVGLPDLQRKLRSLEHVVQQRILEGALVAGALVIQNAAKENCPKVSGNLARSIHIGGHSELSELGKKTVADKTAKQGTGSTGTDLGKPERSGARGTAAVRVGTNVEYAARVEFGFVGQDSLGRHFNQAGQPYLTRAATEKQGEALKEVEEALRDAVRAAL